MNTAEHPYSHLRRAVMASSSNSGRTCGRPNLASKTFSVVLIGRAGAGSTNSSMSMKDIHLFKGSLGRHGKTELNGRLIIRAEGAPLGVHGYDLILKVGLSIGDKSRALKRNRIFDFRRICMVFYHSVGITRRKHICATFL